MFRVMSFIKIWGAVIVSGPDVMAVFIIYRNLNNIKYKHQCSQAGVKCYNASSNATQDQPAISAVH